MNLFDFDLIYDFGLHYLFNLELCFHVALLLFLYYIVQGTHTCVEHVQLLLYCSILLLLLVLVNLFHKQRQFVVGDLL
jgi:hypothetical protein